MKKIGIIFLMFLLSILTSFVEKNESMHVTEPTISLIQYTEQVYDCLTEDNLSYEAFKIGVKGYFNLFMNGNLTNSKYLTIIDMTLSCNEERLFIIDMESQEVVHRSLVAHGKNTGEEFAINFSNKQRSHQTSLGFYKTAETYNGKRGFSLKLDGLEHSNSNARDRGVVIHSADYVGADYIQTNGRLGRSFGCPSIPKEGYEAVVDLLKDGSCFFIYYPEKNYLSQSKLVNSMENYLLTNTGKVAFSN